MQYQAREIAVAPGIIEKGFASNENFYKLSDGFKRIVTNDTEQRDAMRIPIVGYTGHRKGERAENIFAKNFREQSFEAVRNLRNKQNTTRSNYCRS
jgi:hypothetical protein